MAPQIRIKSSGSFRLSWKLDPETKELLAIYVRLRQGRFVKKTVEISEHAFIDLDDKGQVLGIEMIGPCHITAKELKLAADKFHEPALLRFSRVRELVPA